MNAGRREPHRGLAATVPAGGGKSPGFTTLHLSAALEQQTPLPAQVKVGAGSRYRQTHRARNRLQSHLMGGRACLRREARLPHVPKASRGRGRSHFGPAKAETATNF
jgi:hypothetical protein